jgi:DNA-binding response OmpR family regulator
MPGKKVLIVDYDSRSLDSLAKLFERQKFEVIKAADGLAAYEKFRLERPDIVVLEAILPKLHGFDLASRIRLESRGAVPVVIVTGLYRGSRYRHEALTSFGASAYFEKPYKDEELLRTVLGLLKERIEIGLDLPRPEAVAAFLADELKRPARSRKDKAGD